MRTYRIDPGSVDDLMHRVDRDFAEAIAQEPGFIAYECIDMGGGKICTLSMFRTQEQADASNELAAEWVAENLADFSIERMGIMGGDVMVSRAQAEMLEPAHH
jgi:hypothetical protein